ncbi:Ig-like domain-containing protein, partial [Cellulophaga baltica]|uniref:Ig-like domain-containing protein n=1 Tax=Cellulophaga TaxID=104264 RepID=UPI001C065F87
LVTGISGGDAIITATTENGVSGTTEVSVSQAEVTVTNVEVTPNPVSLEEGETQQLNATITPTDATNQTVTWSSSDTSIAIVDSSTGEVTGISEGDAIITATTENGVSVTTEVNVSNSEVAVTNVEVTSNPVSLEVGETEQLSATITPTDATNQIVTWSSSNTSIATVNSSTGLVTGVADGNGIIIATAHNGVSGTSNIEVAVENVPPEAIEDNLQVVENSTNNTLDVLANDTYTGVNLFIISIENPINGTASIGAGQQTITYDATTGNDRFDYTIEDENGLTSTGTINISTIANQLPEVEIDNVNDIILPTNSVSLSGSATDSDGNIVSYEWTKINGGNATISNSSNSSTTVNTLEEGTYTFRLTVTDNLGATNYQEIDFTVNAAPEPSFSFFIDNISSPVTTSTATITFNITPNATAIEQGVEFTMYYEDRSGLPNISTINYNGGSYIVTIPFTANSGISNGTLEGPFSNCEAIQYEFFVSTNLNLPIQYDTVSFIVQNGTICP